MISREETGKWIGAISAFCLAVAFSALVFLAFTEVNERFTVLLIGVSLVLHLVMEYFGRQIGDRL